MFAHANLLTAEAEPILLWRFPEEAARRRAETGSRRAVLDAADELRRNGRSAFSVETLRKQVASRRADLSPSPIVCAIPLAVGSDINDYRFIRSRRGRYMLVATDSSKPASQTCRQALLRILADASAGTVLTLADLYEQLRENDEKWSDEHVRVSIARELVRPYGSEPGRLRRVGRGRNEWLG